MKRVVVTGLGFITSIGNSRAEVLESLRSGRSGIAIHPELDRPEIPVKLAGTIKDFDFSKESPEAWTFPSGLQIPRLQLRSMSPHVIYAFAAMQEAIANAGLAPAVISNSRTGMMCASAGSTRLLYRNVDKMLRDGILRCHPFSLPASIAGTLNFNLVSAFKIRGASTGFVSACSSSAHALGNAFDQIRYGRQDTMFVVGAEDCDVFSILPFASCRALTRGIDPALTPCAFDVKRDGFAATGGATVLVLEEREQAEARGAKVYAEMSGWAQTSDGHDIMAPEPTGEGLARAMSDAMTDAKVTPEQVDYINAHGTSTPSGDRAELSAIKKVFGTSRPLISSTKSQTGHALSMAGAFEAAICCLALDEGFTPVSINITELDPAAEGLRVVTQPVTHAPSVVLSNSAAFGGANVSIALRRT